MRRLAAGAALVALLAAACTGDAPTDEPSGVRDPLPIPSVAPGGAPTAAAAIRALCVPPTIPDAEPAAPGDAPVAVAEVEDAVEGVRGLTYLDPVAVDQIDDAEMDRRLRRSFADSYPEALYDRRTVAWRTLGAIPAGADLHEALQAFLTGAVVGFYDPATGELVFLGSGEELGITERLVLAHELTHAIDDQHFDLSRLDPLVLRCRDDAFTAALGVVEGSAQYFSSQVLATSDLDLGELADALADQVQPDLSAVPPFVIALQEWPYLSGMSFVTALAAQGGTEAVDAALAGFPVSSEQVIHPERYPGDVPTEVDVPDASAALGPAWGDLDAMEVGEAWLRAWLDLELGVLDAREAAAGWDGGVYRAWTDGTDVVVVLRTAWDTAADATAFADAVADRSPDAEVTVDGRTVTLAVATDAALASTALDAVTG
jgi:hypothetical protein